VLVRHPESVAIVAVEGDRLLVVRQERAGADGVTTERPSGKLDPGEGPDDAVRRELAEECGLEAGGWRRVGAFWAAPAYSTEFVHVYEATGLGRSTAEAVLDPDEAIETARVPLERALGELSDAVSIAALALWRDGRAP
jgi:8-oxo-dGTP pyrophosphatase MutT (NUDIX family)